MLPADARARGPLPMAAPRRGVLGTYARAVGASRPRMGRAAARALRREAGRVRGLRRDAADRPPGAGLGQRVEPAPGAGGLRPPPGARAHRRARERDGLVAGDRRRLPGRGIPDAPHGVEQPAPPSPRLGGRLALPRRMDALSPRASHRPLLDRRGGLPEAPARRHGRPRGPGVRGVGARTGRGRAAPPVPVRQRRRGVRLPAGALRGRTGARRGRRGVGATRGVALGAPRPRRRLHDAAGGDREPGPLARTGGGALLRRRSHPGQEATEVQRHALGADGARRPGAELGGASSARASSSSKGGLRRTGARFAAPGRRTCART